MLLIFTKKKVRRSQVEVHFDINRHFLGSSTFTAGVTITSPFILRATLPLSTLLALLSMVIVLRISPGFILYFTSIFPVAPGAIGYFEKLGTVQPQVDWALVIIKGSFPVLVNSNTLTPLSVSLETLP